MKKSKTSQLTRVEWNKLNWRKLERAVFKLQNRIFRAAQRGDKKAVRKLQKTLLRSWSARCLVVRQGIESGNQPGTSRLVVKKPEKNSHQYRAKNNFCIDGNFSQNRGKEINQNSQLKRGDRLLKPVKRIQTCTPSLSLLFKANKTANLEDLIPKINLIIQDWRHQNQHHCNAKIRKRIHHDLHQMIMQWGRRRTQSYKRAYHLYLQQIDSILKWG